MKRLPLRDALKNVRPYLARLAWASAGSAAYGAFSYAAGNYNRLSDAALGWLLAFMAWTAIAGILSSLLALALSFIPGGKRGMALWALGAGLICAVFLTLSAFLRAASGGLSV